MPIARRHTHRERGCRVRVRCGAGGRSKQHSTNPEAPHYPAAFKQEFRTRTPQQATAYSEGANAWRTEVRWGGRYEPGREETNTILITNTKHKPRTAYQAHDVRIRLVLDSRSAPPRVILRRNRAIAKPKADKRASRRSFKT